MRYVQLSSTSTKGRKWSSPFPKTLLQQKRQMILPSIPFRYMFKTPHINIHHWPRAPKRALCRSLMPYVCSCWENTHTPLSACLQDSMSMELQSRSSVRDRYISGPLITMQSAIVCLGCVCLASKIRGERAGMTECRWYAAYGDSCPAPAAHSCSASGAARRAAWQVDQAQGDLMINIEAARTQQAPSSMGTLSFLFLQCSLG